MLSSRINDELHTHKQNKLPFVHLLTPFISMFNVQTPHYTIIIIAYYASWQHI